MITTDHSVPFLNNAGATSEEFYRARGASAVMRAAHFPDDLFCFLQLEALTILQTIRTFNCDVLVEMGCYDGRALEVARSAAIPYLGVDINDEAVDALRQRIINEGLRRTAKAVTGDVTSPEQWNTAVVGEVPLYVFPFNLMGNLSDPTAVFREMLGGPGYGIVTVFNSDVWTTEVRRDYYSACGITLSGIEKAPYGGVLFRGEGGFGSQSFSSDCLDRFLGDCGVEPLQSARNQLGQCVTVRFR